MTYYLNGLPFVYIQRSICSSPRFSALENPAPSFSFASLPKMVAPTSSSLTAPPPSYSKTPAVLRKPASRSSPCFFAQACHSDLLSVVSQLQRGRFKTVHQPPSSRNLLLLPRRVSRLLRSCLFIFTGFSSVLYVETNSLYYL